MMQRLAVIMLLLVGFGCSGGAPIEPGRAAEKPVKRVGMVVGIQPDMIERYKALHADLNPGVRDLLSKYHMRNFSIYLGADRRAVVRVWILRIHQATTTIDDMAQLAREPRNIEWLKMCDPMQIPLPGAQGWKEMERVYFNP